MNERDVHDEAVGPRGSVAESACAVGAAVLDGLVERVKPRFGY
ncbi:MAG: hypothetical protein AAFR76_14180 [Planctomycetota bacterium]